MSFKDPDESLQCIFISKTITQAFTPKQRFQKSVQMFKHFGNMLVFVGIHTWFTNGNVGNKGWNVELQPTA